MLSFPFHFSTRSIFLGTQSEKRSQGIGILHHTENSSNTQEPFSICVNTNQIICQFIHIFSLSVVHLSTKNQYTISKLLHQNMKHYYAYQLLCTVQQFGH